MTPRAASSTLLWGVFCACSWTWCIGLFLPALMIERFGLPGLIAFALPNLAGCVGFGYLIADRGASVGLIERHGKAMVAFSLVTVAYHVFFVTFAFTELLPMSVSPPWAPVVAAAAAFGLALLLSDAGNVLWLVLTVATYALSLLAFAAVGSGAAEHVAGATPRALGHLAWLTPILIVGFLLCPFLDLTFHRAFQSAPSRHAFAVFGAAFAVMIALTCLIWSAPHRLRLPLVLAHLLAQSVFTMGAHLRETRASPVLAPGPVRTSFMLLPLAAVIILPLARLAGGAADPGESLYLRFLVFYGLLFPAYVLVFVGPWRPSRRTPRSLLILGVIVVAFAPLYELAFIHDVGAVLAIPILAIVAWIAARKAGGP